MTIISSRAEVMDTRRAYLTEGEVRAVQLGNRGPIRLTEHGDIAPDILESYDRHGFYVFENVLSAPELEDLGADLATILDRLPVSREAIVDRQGRPAIGIDSAVQPFIWAKPLSDPFGGSELMRGRHPVKMFEPKPLEDAPSEVVVTILGSLQFSDAALRLYGHPLLLKLAEAVNGPDFVPFNEAIFIKEPGLGASIAWHQDGWTHWDSVDWDSGSHGFNFMAQQFGSTAANGLWVVPGSHELGKVDIVDWATRAGGDMLPDAVPLICAPGDVVMTNRQLVHGSFANTSPDWRVTWNLGFHRRRSVLGVASKGHRGDALEVFDAERIEKRARIIGYAIDARRQRFGGEEPFLYKPHAEQHQTWIWNEDSRKQIIDYNINDMTI